jgi:hypothetical protein
LAAFEEEEERVFVAKPGGGRSGFFNGKAA